MPPLHLAAALHGSGWHPAVRRAPLTGPDWADLARTAEHGLLDLVTIEDPSRSRLDARSIAELVSAATDRIGLVPAITASWADPSATAAALADPSATAAALADLDRVSHGRAGWRVRTSVPAGETPDEVADLRRGLLGSTAGKALVTDVLDRAADAVAGVRRVRPGPLVVAAGHGWQSFRLAARVADVVLTAPHDAFGAAMLTEHVRAAERDVGRTGPPLRILGDLIVLLDDTAEAARARLDRLDAEEMLGSDVAVVATTAAGLADMMLAWAPSGLDGYRLRPARSSEDLGRIVQDLVPELQRRGAFRTAYAEPSLRSRFDLDERAGVLAS